MSERITAPASPAYDTEIVADLADLFGPARFAQMLAGLDEEIVRRLETAAPDGPQLGSDAHVLVSVSGTLGFARLSEACALLERATLAETDTVEPLRNAQAAAAAARRAIMDLRARSA